MAKENNQPNTHLRDLRGRFRVGTTNPTNPNVGDTYYNTSTNCLMRYKASKWVGFKFT